MADEVAQLLDGKAAKLRASCDVCNESKVRCSQTKPSCTRCQKQGVVCVYGLSRRSHKSAPRVGAQRPSPAIDTPPILNDHSTEASTSTRHPSSRNSVSSFSSQSLYDAERTTVAAGSEAQTCSDQPPINFVDDLPATDFSLSSLIFHDDQGSLGTCVTSPSAFFDQFDQFGPSDTIVPHDLLDHNELPSGPLQLATDFSSNGCHCVSRATTELMSTMLLSDTSGNMADVQLSVIKRAIQTSQDCIDCTCITHELSIMTVMLLVGRIIKGFEVTLGAESPLASAATSLHNGNDSGESAAPKMTWGKLPIDMDEEYQLRQHLLLLNFQKLERLLRQLSDSVKQLRLRQGSNNPAHVMACECMHMWLEQWANVVKNGFTR